MAVHWVEYVFHSFVVEILKPAQLRYAKDPSWSILLHVSVVNQTSELKTSKFLYCQPEKCQSRQRKVSVKCPFQGSMD